MKKVIILSIIGIIGIAAIIGGVVMLNSKPKTNLAPITSVEELSALVDKVYEGRTDMLPSLMTMPIDLADADAVNSMTGLENGDNLEYLVVSEPMINAQAYSFVLAKVKDGVNANEVAKTMSENINTRKWICVSAEKLYATSSGDVVCLVMSSEEMAKPVYEKFKELAGTVGQVYEKTEEAPELPEDMVF